MDDDKLNIKQETTPIADNDFSKTTHYDFEKILLS